MLRQETEGFLKKVHPLDLLPEDDLAELVGEVTLEYFPRDSRILTQGGAPAEHLHLIKKGGVRVSMASSEAGEDAIVIDERSDEDYFGLISLISGEAPRATIDALEDTICYLVPKPKLLDVLRRNPAVNERLLKSYLIHFIDRTYLETKKKYAESAGGQQTLVATRIGDVVRREPVTAAATTSIRDAARRMAEHRISSLVVLGEGGEPVGIVTDRDLREKVVATGHDLALPLAGIMSSPLIGVEAGEHCFAALIRMMRHGIHHLAVLEGGGLRGVVTHHDFMVLQGASPAVLVKEVAKTNNVGELADTAARLRKTVSTLIREGAKAHDVSATITELAERYLNRVIDFGEREHGAPPLPYTLFLIGDGGRRELTLDCRLELAVAHQDTDEPRLRDRAGEYFDGLRALLERAHHASGCAVEGRLAAANVRSLSAWRTLFEGWTAEPPRDLRYGDFFDLRAIRGEAPAVDALRHLLHESASDERMMAHLVADTVANRPPIGFFRRFVVEKSGEHRDELDLYEKGLRPLAEVVRILALERGVGALSTAGRLRELADRRGEEIAQAFEYVAALLLHHQLVRIDEGGEPDSFLRLEDLAPREKKTLKEAFQLTARLHERLAKAHRGAG